MGVERAQKNGKSSYQKTLSLPHVGEEDPYIYGQPKLAHWAFYGTGTIRPQFAMSVRQTVWL